MSAGNPIVECVPNFSNGRDKDVIEAIAEAIREVPGASLLDVDPGEATNRTVFTMVGAPEAVIEAAFRAIAKGQQLIDMRKHKGAHPRMGACDVCPFVPVANITMEECAELARQLGARVGEELGIPVYLYEHAASKPEWKNLAVVRQGEYEGLEARSSDPYWAPDFGPAFNAKSGATAVGARPFLIAYNINLNTREVRKAMKISAILREKGIARRDENNQVVRDANGEMVRDPGMFRCVKGMGWFIDEYDCAQMTFNMTDYTVSSPHELLDAARRLADQEGVVITGSELVGLIPLDAMLQAGHYYLARQGVCRGAPWNDVIETAIRSMGLRDLSEFDPDHSIIERQISKDGPLVSMTVREWADTLSSHAPAPGGGSVAALCGSMAAGLAAMVANLTVGKRGYEDKWELLDEPAVKAQALKEAFLADIDNDTAAFDAVMAAFGLPKGTPDEKKARAAAIRTANQNATLVPLGVLERCVDTLPCIEAALQGNENARSDAGVAVLMCKACAEGAWYNVCINTKDMKDREFVAMVRERADRALAIIDEAERRLTSMVREQLGG
jgi:glutamate formiminotransferase/formiminotetrahydrofolate cyclodeaminase